jgi:1-deoxy-D-xylulose-5-phosphate synthase
MVIASPSDEGELRHMLYSAICYDRPVAIRYPRGSGQGVDITSELQELPLGKGEMLRAGGDLTIVAFGPVVNNALEAAQALSGEGLDCGVINARFAKPLDSALILDSAEATHNLLTIEENVLNGGLGSAVVELISSSDLTDVKIKCLGLPDKFIEHGPQELLRSLYNIDSEGIAQYIRVNFPELFSRPSVRIRREET